MWLAAPMLGSTNGTNGRTFPSPRKFYRKALDENHELTKFCQFRTVSSLPHRIIAMLSPDEQALFKERIRFLDKKIHPGLKKLHWALKGASAFFITECRIHASKVGHETRSVGLTERLACA